MQPDRRAFSQGNRTLLAGPIPAIPVRRTLVLAACLMATFMAAVESTIVATAMPTIVAELGGFNLFSWVFAIYLLTQAVSIPIYGRLADIYGRKVVFYAGAGLFLVGSTLCGFAPSMHWLIGFRALQGIGAGGVQPVALTICGDIYSPSERAKVQGLISSVFGVLKENVEARPHRIDYLGSLLLVISIGAFMVALVQGSAMEPKEVFVLLAVGLGALVVLLIHEYRTPEPMLAIELLRDRVIVIGAVGGGLVGAVMMGVSAFLPAYVQGAMGRSAIMAGLVLGAMSVTWAIASILGGRLMVRTSYRLAAIIGAISLLAGCTVLVFLDPERGVPWATAGSLVIGIGMGLCNTAFIVSIQAAVPWGKRGAATSSCLFLRFIGQALGAASFGAVLNATILRRSPDDAHLMDQLLEPSLRRLLQPDEQARLTELIAAGLHNAYLLGCILSAAALALVIFLPARLSPSQQTLR
jgi:MFS family permease